MKICSGTTRFVILVGPYAIKIARIRIFHFAMRLIMHGRNGQVRERMEVNQDTSIMKAIVRRLLLGVQANLAEQQIYKERPQKHLMPTLFTICGLVNVQCRGIPVEEGELQAQNPFQHFVHIDAIGQDLTKAANFSKLRGQIYLHDYGQPELRAYL
jgi:hypothetical protein